MICASCEQPRSSESQRFCPMCGVPYPAPPMILSDLAVPAPRRLGYVTPMTYLLAGASCPVCASPAFSNYYSLWYFAIAIIFFPLGTIAFFAPVKICQNGHSYGLGVTVTRICQILVFALIAVYLAVGYLVVHTVHYLMRSLQ